MKIVTRTHKQFLLPLILFLCFFSGVAAAAQTASGQKQGDVSARTDSFFIAESISFTEKMGKLAASDGYTGAMTQSPELMQLFDIIGAGTYGKPSAVYFLTLSAGNAEKLAQTAIPVDFGKLNQTAKQELIKKINGFMFAKMANGEFGSSFLGASSILETGKSYIRPKEWNGPVSVLLVYPDTFASFTHFYESGDGVISANATFMYLSDTIRDNLAKNRDPFLGMLEEDFFTLTKK